MKVFVINAVRFDGMTKEFEIEAKSEKAAMKKFKELFGKFWVGNIIK